MGKPARKKRHNKRWSENDVEALKEMAGISTVAAISTRIKRTPQAIINKAFELGISLYVIPKQLMELKPVKPITTQELSDVTGLNETQIIRAVNTEKLTAFNKDFRKNTEPFIYELDEARAYLKRHRPTLKMLCMKCSKAEATGDLYCSFCFEDFKWFEEVKMIASYDNAIDFSNEIRGELARRSEDFTRLSNVVGYENISAFCRRTPSKVDLAKHALIADALGLEIEVIIRQKKQGA